MLKYAGEDLHDMALPMKCFLEQVNNHARACVFWRSIAFFVLQCLDCLAYIDFYHERIKAFHVKDAEFNPTGKRKKGVYGGYQSWN